VNLLWMDDMMAIGGKGLLIGTVREDTHAWMRL
jgi:hypothetical protein